MKLSFSEYFTLVECLKSELQRVRDEIRAMTETERWAGDTETATARYAYLNSRRVSLQDLIDRFECASVSMDV